MNRNILVIALLAMLLTACGGITAKVTEQEIVKIGVIAPLTGPLDIFEEQLW